MLVVLLFLNDTGTVGKLEILLARSSRLRSIFCLSFIPEYNVVPARAKKQKGLERKNSVLVTFVTIVSNVILSSRKVQL